MYNDETHLRDEMVILEFINFLTFLHLNMKPYCCFITHIMHMIMIYMHGET